jgi:hypothetical protein
VIKLLTCIGSAFVARARWSRESSSSAGRSAFVFSSPTHHCSDVARETADRCESAKGFAVGLGVVVYANHANDDAF